MATLADKIERLSAIRNNVKILRHRFCAIRLLRIMVNFCIFFVNLYKFASSIFFLVGRSVAVTHQPTRNSASGQAAPPNIFPLASITPYQNRYFFIRQSICNKIIFSFQVVRSRSHYEEIPDQNLQQFARGRKIV